MRRYWPYFILGVILVLSFSASWIAPYDPTMTTAAYLQAPSTDHLLGTDALGRDVLSRLLFGGKNTLLVASIATIIAVLPGAALGVLWGLAPRRWADALTIFVSALLALPALLVALICLTLLGQGTGQISLAVGLSQIAFVAQIIRGAVMSAKHAEHITSAEALGANAWHILRWHILRDIRPTILITIGLIFSYSMLNSAALTFLGLGALGVPDWGVMLADARAAFDTAPLLALLPGLALSSVVFAVNTILNRVR